MLLQSRACLGMWENYVSRNQFSNYFVVTQYTLRLFI